MRRLQAECCNAAWPKVMPSPAPAGHFDENGYYACSLHPEGPWQFRVAPTYTNVVAMADGTNQTLVQRERRVRTAPNTAGLPATGPPAHPLLPRPPCTHTHTQTHTSLHTHACTAVALVHAAHQGVVLANAHRAHARTMAR